MKDCQFGDSPVNYSDSDSVFLLFANIILIKKCLFVKFIKVKFMTPYLIMRLSSVGNFAHNGSVRGSLNGTIGKTLNDIGIPLVPLIEP